MAKVKVVDEHRRKFILDYLLALANGPGGKLPDGTISRMTVIENVNLLYEQVEVTCTTLVKEEKS